jgi:Ku70/Ku80 beta-barrel domain
LLAAPKALLESSHAGADSETETPSPAHSTGNKVKHQFIDAETGDVIENEDHAKGYPVAKNAYLLVDDDELDKIKSKARHMIDIEKFVPRAEIDPCYYDAPYYIAPSERVAEEAFDIIRDCDDVARPRRLLRHLSGHALLLGANELADRVFLAVNEFLRPEASRLPLDDDMRRLFHLMGKLQLWNVKIGLLATHLGPVPQGRAEGTGLLRFRYMIAESACESAPQ